MDHPEEDTILDNDDTIYDVTDEDEVKCAGVRRSIRERIDLRRD